MNEINSNNHVILIRYTIVRTNKIDTYTKSVEVLCIKNVVMFDQEVEFNHSHLFCFYFFGKRAKYENSAFVILRNETKPIELKMGVIIKTQRYLRTYPRNSIYELVVRIPNCSIYLYKARHFLFYFSRLFLL